MVTAQPNAPRWVVTPSTISEALEEAGDADRSEIRGLTRLALKLLFCWVCTITSSLERW